MTFLFFPFYLLGISFTFHYPVQLFNNGVTLLFPEDFIIAPSALLINVAYGNFFRFLFTDVSFSAVPTGFEPVPHTVTGWYCSHSTMKPIDSSIGFEPMKNGFADHPLRPLGQLEYVKTKVLFLHSFYCFVQKHKYE